MSERIWDGLHKNALYKSTYTLLYFTTESSEENVQSYEIDHCTFVDSYFEWQGGIADKSDIMYCKNTTSNDIFASGVAVVHPVTLTLHYMCVLKISPGQT